MLLIGPPGSGKTTWILERLESAVREGRGSKVRLVVPTQSMARHLAHELARRGLTVPGDIALPIRRAVAELTPELAEPKPAVVEWLLSRAVEEKGDRLGRAAATPGGLARLARAVDDLEAARVSPDLLRKLARSPFERALAEVYAVYESFLAVQGLASTAERRFRAAEEAAFHGLLGAEEIYFDGFFDYSPAERDLVRSLATSGAKVVATAPPSVEAELLPGFGREYLRTRRRPDLAPEIFVAPSLEAEVSEVARRVLEARAGGKLLREIGVVVRTPDRYASVIQSVFERYGIPFRLTLPRPATSLEPVGFLRDLLAAAGEGFPAEETLAALSRPASKAGASEAGPSFLFRMRDAAPFEGVEFLIERAGAELKPVLEELRPAEAWARNRAAPREWAERMKRLAAAQVAVPSGPPGLSPDRVQERRALAAGLAAWNDAAEQAAELLRLKNRAEASFQEWATTLDRVLAGDRRTVRDDRRDVVNVLSVYEARQWELSVVFVCGMVEGWFPASKPEEPFLTESLRRRLRQAGPPIRTRREIDADEAMLFESATTRASEKLVLSRPELDEASAPLLRSFFLPPEPEDGDPVAEPVAPRERAADDPNAPEGGPPIRIADESLWALLRERHPDLSPSRLNTFLRCPFELFAGRTLGLQTRPVAPTERLDALAKGNVLHDTLSRWSEHGRAKPIDVYLEAALAERLEKLNLEPTFVTEVAAAALRRDLKLFVDGPLAQPFAGSMEAKFETDVRYVVGQGPEGVAINARIDRYETFEGPAALVVDYKSGSGKLKDLSQNEWDGKNVQASLYLAGLRSRHGLRPAGYLYIGFRGGPQAHGRVHTDLLSKWPEPPKTVEAADPEKLNELLDRAESAAADAAAEIRSGRIGPTPTDPGHCDRFCDFRAVCRVRTRG